MKSRARAAAALVVLAACCASRGGMPVTAMSQSPNQAQKTPTDKPATASRHARGAFDVKLAPLEPDDTSETSTLGRMSIAKEYHGDLEGTARGQMLTALTGVKGSAGYVAIERVTGTLHGRQGSFVLQHTGVMDRGAQQLAIAVVPDSGSGQLVGLSGTMAITIADGKHSYDFAYVLPSHADRQ